MAGTLRIDVPAAASTPAFAARSRRRPEYISLSTKSISIEFAPTTGGASVSVDQNLVPGSANCTEAGACTVAFQIEPGRYVANVLLFDGTLNAQGVPSGNALSSGQSVPVTFASGSPNSVSLTLDGIPHSVQIATVSQAVHGSQSTGFTFYGTAPQPFTVNALDADGNIIVGPGAPALGLKATGGFTVKATTGGVANAFSVTPPGVNGSTTTLSASATSSGTGCSQAGAQCNATAPVSNDVQTLFVALLDPAGALALPSPFTATGVTLAPGGIAPTLIAASATGECAINRPEDGFEHILLYASPYTGAPTILPPFRGELPTAVAFDSKGNLFIATAVPEAPPDSRGNRIGATAVQDAIALGTTRVVEYAPPYLTLTAAIPNVAGTYDALALDAAGNLFVANSANAEVQEFAPPYAGVTPKTITAGITRPIALALDATSNLYVENQPTSGPSSIAVFASPYDSAPKYTITPPGVANALAVSPGGSVFVGTTGTLEYAPPYSGTPTAIGAAVAPQSVVLDGLGNLIVTTGDAVLEYAPPYTGTATEIGIDNPASLTALSP